MDAWGSHHRYDPSPESKLPDIPELACLRQRLFLVIVGSDARRLSASFCDAVEKNFHYQGKRHHGDSHSSLQTLARRLSRNSLGTLQFVTDNPPLWCEAPLTALRELRHSLVAAHESSSSSAIWSPRTNEDCTRQVSPQADGQQATWESRRSFLSQRSGMEASQTGWPSEDGTDDEVTMSRPCKKRSTLRERVTQMTTTSRRLSRVSCQSSDGVPVVRLCCHPVENYCEPVSVCKTVEQLRSMSVLLLADTRQDAEVFHALLQRVQEVMAWVKKFKKDHNVKRLPALFIAVLQHRAPTVQEEDALTESLNVHASMSIDEAAPCDRDEVALNEQIRSITSEDPKKNHYYCDFDDSEALMKAVLRFVSVVLEIRKSESDDMTQTTSIDFDNVPAGSRCRCDLM